MKSICLSILLAALASCVFAAETIRPNFVFILGEGHGWTSTSVLMDDRVPDSKSDFLRTPSFEKLAAEGMRFSHFNAPSPRCTPSRATFFTGKSPAQLHMTFVSEGKGDSGGAGDNHRLLPPRSSVELPTKETTIAELLKRTGYATAHFGKWHVGTTDPSEHGFDESDGPTKNGGPENVAHPHPKQLYGMTRRGIDFMTRRVRAGKPFYLQVSHYASKRIDDALPETVAAVRSRSPNLDDTRVGEAAAILDLDITLGMILEKIQQLGIADNTYVIYTTDHGTPGRNANFPLNNGKGTVWDGGLRVPFFIRGPRIKPGTFCHTLATGADLFPTFAELAKVHGTLPDGIEGGSLVPVLTNAGVGTVKRTREELVIHFPRYDKDELGPASAILLGNFKLLRFYDTGEQMLFDPSQDIGERHDLSREMPEKVVELAGRLDRYLHEINAQMPTPNPNYDPDKPSQVQGGNKQQRGGRRRNRDRGTDVRPARR